MHISNRQTFLVTTAMAVTSVAALQGPALADGAGDVGSALLDRYAAAFNAHDVDAFANVIAVAYVQHNGRAGQGLAGLQAALRSYFKTFPDFHMQVDDRLVAGDKIVGRNTMTATHTQPVQLGPGTPVFAATGKTLSWGAMDIWRVADGKFVEHWDEQDFFGLARQLRGE